MRVSYGLSLGPLGKAPSGHHESCSQSLLCILNFTTAKSQVCRLPMLVFPHPSPNVPGQEIFNDTGVVITRNGSLVSACFDGTVTVSVIALSNILHASCSLPEEYRDRTGGLLGKKQVAPPMACRRPGSLPLSQPPWTEP